MTCSGTIASSPGPLSPTSQRGTDSWSLESAWNQGDPLELHKGLESIASSLSLLTKTIGMAIEEQRHLVESKSVNSVHKERHSPQMKNASESVPPDRCQVTPSSLKASSEKPSPVIKDKQMKCPRELAMAMATKAKFLLHQLKVVKQDLILTKERCSQLEEENKQLRESIHKCDGAEDDDLVRLQLEALLAEKARLAQENSTYVREVQFLQELVQYQQLKLRQLAIPDDSFMFDDEINFDAENVAVDLLPLYADENENNATMESPSACQTT